MSLLGDGMAQFLGAHDLAGDLAGLGVEPGDGLFVHSALSQIGHVMGGPRGFIEALISAVGPEGLIGMPGFSGDAYDPIDMMETETSEINLARCAEIRAQVPGFDPERSNVRAMGAVAEAFRCWPGVVRSPHPTSSVLLLGRDAAEFASPHDALDWATGPKSPWGRLRHRTRMKVLLVGVGWNRCSALHSAESIASHRRIQPRRFKPMPGPDVAWVEAPDVADDLGRLFPLVGADWEATGSVTVGRIGAAEARLTGYDALVAFAQSWIGARNAADGVVATPQFP